MTNHQYNYDWSWLDDIEQSHYRAKLIDLKQTKAQKIFQEEDQPQFIQKVQFQGDKQGEKNKLSKNQNKKQKISSIKKSTREMEIYYQDQMQKEDSNQRNSKVQKQGQYSKVYRQKKKAHYKILQEQNFYLKKKIDQLQQRLRQKQLQLNRIKFKSGDSQIPIQQLNKQFLQKVQIIFNSTGQKSTLLETQQFEQQSKQAKKINIQNLKPQAKAYQKFIQIYEHHGFGGKGKIQILQYYINELLQNCLKDSQKYYYICMIKNKGWAHMNKESVKSQFNVIDYAVGDIMEYNIEINKEEQQKMLLIQTLMKPILQNLKNSCRKLYKSFRQVINSLNKTQQFIKKAYNKNEQLIIKRLKIENWFQHNKYLKQMINLRAQWIQMIKDQQDPQLEQLIEIESNGKKKRNKNICIQK